MKDLLVELLSKFTRYDWFTTLLPGICCLAIGRRLGLFETVPKSYIETFGFIFFLGLVSSRIGASVIEPISKFKKFNLWGPYADYLNFRLKDEKGADMLVTNANWFRSLTGMVLLLICITATGFMCDYFGLEPSARQWCLLVALMALFADSYRRQLRFIRGRIEYYKSLNNSSQEQGEQDA